MVKPGSPITIYKVDGKKGGECKYCEGWFRHFVDLADHIQTEHDAEICDEHRLIFDNFEDMLAHSVQCHRACPSCGRRFQSEGGLKLHLKNEHKADSNIQCHGCGETFKTAGPFIGHLSNGYCKGVKREEFHDHIHHKAVINDKLGRGSGLSNTYTKSHAAPSEIGEEFDSNAPVSIEPDRGFQGNRQINGSTGGNALLDVDDEEQHNLTGNMLPAAYEPYEASNVNDVMDDVAENFDNLAVGSGAPTENEFSNSTAESCGEFNETKEEEDDFPPLPSASTARTSPVSPDDAKAKGPDSQHGSEPENPASNGNLDTVWDDVRAKEKKLENDHTSVRSGPIKAPAGSSMNFFTNRFWNPRSQAWDPENFFNPTMGKYECPHPGCQWTDTTPSGITSHADVEHRSASINCPRCFRFFKNLQSLVSHCENNSSRKCNIRETESYPQFLDEITGGYINATKRDEHNRILYEATMPTGFEDRMKPKEEMLRDGASQKKMLKDGGSQKKMPWGNEDKGADFW